MNYNLREGENYFKLPEIKIYSQTERKVFGVCDYVHFA